MNVQSFALLVVYPCMISVMLGISAHKQKDFVAVVLSPIIMVTALLYALTYAAIKDTLILSLPTTIVLIASLVGAFAAIIYLMLDEFDRRTIYNVPQLFFDFSYRIVSMTPSAASIIVFLAGMWAIYAAH